MLKLLNSSFHGDRRQYWQSVREDIVKNWRSFLAALSRRGFEWAIVLFALGIALYFVLPFEPDLRALLISTALILIFAFFIGKSFPKFRLLMLLGVLILAGLTRSAWHSQAIKAPTLPAYEKSYDLTGWVTAIDKGGKRPRLTVAVSSIHSLSSDQTPDYIKLTLYTAPPKVGSGIQIRARLYAPPRAVVPGGYDPAFTAFYKRVGAYGYAISEPSIYEFKPSNLLEKAQWRLVEARYGLAQRIIEQSPPKTAGLQAALLTGVRAYIPTEHTEALRTAGLAHILAISGLHMGVLAGSIYVLSCLLLACIVPLSRRYDVRKLAAIIGITSATAYLCLSGASVATQRAYIMALIVFGAVILDRRALSIRSVAIAALITLGLHPEALVSPGFQMSFAAVGALVVVFRYLEDRNIRISRRGRGVIDRVQSHFMTLSLTSLVAGGATAGFAAYHFNRMASFGLFANLLAMPIFTFWVMPCALLSFLLMPLGWETLPLKVMSVGLEWLINISNWVSDWPGALVYVRAAPGWVLGLYGIGCVALCLGPRFLRIMGVGCLVISLGVWINSSIPIMRITQDGHISFWDDDFQTLWVSQTSGDRYGRSQFVWHSGLGFGADIKRFRNIRASCDSGGCRWTLRGQQISWVTHPSELIEACQNSDIVILSQRQAGVLARRLCDPLLIDWEILRHMRALNVYITPQSIRLKGVYDMQSKPRIWEGGSGVRRDMRD